MAWPSIGTVGGDSGRLCTVEQVGHGASRRLFPIAVVGMVLFRVLQYLAVCSSPIRRWIGFHNGRDLLCSLLHP